MIVSWNWLQDYVRIDVTEEELTERLSMAGLNHEGTTRVGDDLAIDLEVTSNRPDCLGHIGVAREISVLLEVGLEVSAPKPEATIDNGLPKVRIDCPELCQRYTARIVRGCKVGPSPKWLQDRLLAIGIAAVNNIVDITNYVMMECGQPLHAFDADKIAKHEIIVRAARKDEEFLAINHRTYTLTPEMCVIADAHRGVAIGGVMGGADTEVSELTGHVLVESAEFNPLAIRTTARSLNLHSPSSYRFERRVDPAGVDWASLRCCELILDLAGGEMVQGVADAVAVPRLKSAPILLRFSQLKRILGIDIPADRVREILLNLGNEEVAANDQQVEVIPPTWRQDLTREADLVEEVARIHGYDKIPEDVGVNMVSSAQRDVDRIMRRLRTVTAAAGFDEAMTCSVVTDEDSNAFSPWTRSEPLSTKTPMLRGAARLRRSLIPSLLEVRRINESLSNPRAELFEVAKVYLPRPDQLPEEPLMLAFVSGRDFRELKGTLEAILNQLHVSQQLVTEDCELALCQAGTAVQLELDGRLLGFLGQLSKDGQKAFKLKTDTCIAEIRLDVIEQMATLVPQYAVQSPFPAIARDLNLILDDEVRWDDVACTVRESCGVVLDDLQYLQTYRDPKQDGDGKKRMLLRFQLRSSERTLTGEEADAIADAVINACEDQYGARVLAS